MYNHEDCIRRKHKFEFDHFPSTCQPVIQRLLLSPPFLSIMSFFTLIHSAQHLCPESKSLADLVDNTPYLILCANQIHRELPKSKIAGITWLLSSSETTLETQFLVDDRSSTHRIPIDFNPQLGLGDVSKSYAALPYFPTLNSGQAQIHPYSFSFVLDCT